MAGSRVGDVVASKYRLEELLGSGGMGHVFRAVNMRAGRAVAIKILRTEHATNAPIVERFLREALAANLVRHPNVVDVLDVDKDDDGAPYIVQELLAGEDLSKYIENRGGRLNLEEIEEYVLPVIDAVAEAHAQGVVHRDIKPENVFLAKQTNGKKIPKLLDFGISKVRSAGIKVTDVGVMMGTPAYMAPEQIQGSRETDPRSDVWALGIVLYEILTGSLPFDEGDAPALFVAIATKDVKPLLEVDPSIDPHVSRVVSRCLRRSPDERYPSALELARDLRHVLAGTDIEPTQRRSLPPLAKAAAAGFEIPDLFLPAIPAAPALPTKPTAAFGSGDPPEFGEADLVSPETDSTAPFIQPARIVHAPAPAPTLDLVPASRPTPARHALDAPMEGVMLAGSAVSSQRRPPAPPFSHELSRPQQQQQDMSQLIGVGVIGMVAIVVTAVLMTFVYSPEGWPVLAYITKPTSLMSLIVHGALGLVAFVIAVRLTSLGYKRWKGDIAGGRGSAVFFAVLAGTAFFAALQFGRAAW